MTRWEGNPKSYECLSFPCGLERPFQRTVSCFSALFLSITIDQRDDVQVLAETIVVPQLKALMSGSAKVGPHGKLEDCVRIHVYTRMYEADMCGAAT